MDQTLIIALSVLAGIGTVVMSPVLIVRLVLQHREKLIAMRHRQEGAPGIVEEVAALRREVADLRDTTTKFDMTFDASIDKLEERVDRMEDARRTATMSATPAEETVSVLRRG